MMKMKILLPILFVLLSSCAHKRCTKGKDGKQCQIKKECKDKKQCKIKKHCKDKKQCKIKGKCKDKKQCKIKGKCKDKKQCKSKKNCKGHKKGHGKDYFSKIDTNGDGSISKDEFAAFHKNHH